jgi:hypothetical protein
MTNDVWAIQKECQLHGSFWLVNRIERNGHGLLTFAMNSSDKPLRDLSPRPFSGGSCLHLLDERAQNSTELKASTNFEAGFVVLTAASMKMDVFSVVAPCGLVEAYRRFRGLHHHRPDDGGSKDLWNVGKLLPDNTALQPRWQPFSILMQFIPIHITTTYFPSILPSITTTGVFNPLPADVFCSTRFL